MDKKLKIIEYLPIMSLNIKQEDEKRGMINLPWSWVFCVLTIDKMGNIRNLFTDLDKTSNAIVVRI